MSSTSFSGFCWATSDLMVEPLYETLEFFHYPLGKIEFFETISLIIKSAPSRSLEQFGYADASVSRGDRRAVAAGHQPGEDDLLFQY